MCQPIFLTISGVPPLDNKNNRRHSPQRFSLSNYTPPYSYSFVRNLQKQIAASTVFSSKPPINLEAAFRLTKIYHLKLLPLYIIQGFIIVIQKISEAVRYRNIWHQCSIMSGPVFPKPGGVINCKACIR